jgi:uncharacterized protein YraI
VHGARLHVDCKTTVTFSEDAYHYEIDSGVPYVVYAADRWCSWDQTDGFDHVGITHILIHGGDSLTVDPM